MSAPSSSKQDFTDLARTIVHDHFNATSVSCRLHDEQGCFSQIYIVELEAWRQHHRPVSRHSSALVPLCVGTPYVFLHQNMQLLHEVYTAFSYFSSLERAFLFPRHQAFWHKASTSTSSIQHEQMITWYLQLPKKPRFVLRNHKELINGWRVGAPNALGEFKRARNIEAMATWAMSAALISNRPWPPTFDDAIQDDDLLEIDIDDHFSRVATHKYRLGNTKF